MTHITATEIKERQKKEEQQERDLIAKYLNGSAVLKKIFLRKIMEKYHDLFRQSNNPENEKQTD